MKKAWEETCLLYCQRFGGINSQIWTGRARCPNCGRRCRDDFANAYTNAARPRLAA